MNGLNTSDGSKLLSYIINQDPILSESIDLPVQGESIKPIGQIIVDNTRYKNAFINAINLIAVTLITRNDWDNPWEEFTEQGRINFGQSVREMIVDLVEGQDYNEFKNNPTHFLQHQIPDVYNYIYDINFQKFYKVTVNDTEIAMAFTNETGLYNLISNVYSRLYESYKYDKYLVDKYQLIRRVLDGTVTSVAIPNFSTSSTRDLVAFMKGVSNKMTFRSPNYNPAGLRIATKSENQRTILNCEFDGKVTTDVLATSYFRNDAELKTKLALIDSFSDIDEARLSDLLGDLYIAITDDEKAKLQNVVGMIIADDFFKDFYYSMDTRANESGATKMTEFYNPETLDNTMWLHVWRIFATSPFANAVVFTSGNNAVNSVTVDPASVTVSAGQGAKFNAVVNTTGITNKSVQWTLDSYAVEHKAKINANGELSVPSDFPTGGGSEGQQGIYYLTLDNSLSETTTLTLDGNSFTAIYENPNVTVVQDSASYDDGNLTVGLTLTSQNTYTEGTAVTSIEVAYKVSGSDYTATIDINSSINTGGVQSTYIVAVEGEPDLVDPLDPTSGYDLSYTVTYTYSALEECLFDLSSTIGSNGELANKYSIGYRVEDLIVSFTELEGLYGEGAPVLVTTSPYITMETEQEGIAPSSGSTITVTATSIYDDSKKGTATVTVA